MCLSLSRCEANARYSRRVTRSSEPARLFVYGTLMRGERLAPSLAALNPRDIEPATTTGTLFDLGDYPGLVLAGEDLVRGELVTLPDPEAAFAVLDEIEGFGGDDAPDNLYERRTVTVVTSGGLSIKCWTYVYAAEMVAAVRIASGDWRAPRGRAIAH